MAHKPMFWFGQSVQWVGIFLLVVILVLVHRRKLYGRFPLFTAYILYITVATILRSIFLSKPLIYFYVYWYAEPGAFLLKILAAHESFMHVFRGFYLLKWFRVLFPGTIVVALVSSGWRAYRHPAHASATGTVIIGTAMTAQYIVLAISVLFITLVTLFRVPWRVHEHRIVLGFGISSLAIFSEGALRSEFGTTFTFFNRMLAPMAYILALVIWLTAVWHPLPAKVHAWDDLVSPEAIISGARRQLVMLRSLLRKNGL